MEDDKIKKIFCDFHPEISSSARFMTKLQENMATVEMLKQHDIALRKRHRLAVLVAAACGFVVGVILTSLFPLISNWISMLSIALPRFRILSLTIDYSFVAWIILAATCVITTLNVYEIALARLSSKRPA